MEPVSSFLGVLACGAIIAGVSWVWDRLSAPPKKDGKK